MPLQGENTTGSTLIVYLFSSSIGLVREILGPASPLRDPNFALRSRGFHSSSSMRFFMVPIGTPLPLPGGNPKVCDGLIRPARIRDTPFRRMVFLFLFFFLFFSFDIYGSSPPHGLSESPADLARPMDTPGRAASIFSCIFF